MRAETLNIGDDSGRSWGNVFVGSSIVFNILVSGVYVATKFGNEALLETCGTLVIFLMLPYTYTLLECVKEKNEKKVVISNIVILTYLFSELLLDYVLRIPFREIFIVHVFYIMLFYATEFSIVSVSFYLNRKMGFVVTLTFFILLTCLAYLYLG